MSLLLLMCSGREILCNLAEETTLETEMTLKKLKQHLLKSSQN
jgi:hypothetical protein